VRDFIYRKAKKELIDLISDDALHEITAEGGEPRAVVGKALELVRNAVEKSSIAMFDGLAYCFTGRIYESMSKSDCENLLYELWRDLGLRVQDFNTYASVIFGRALNMMYSKTLHPDPSKVVFENGWLDLDTKRFSKKINSDVVQFSEMSYIFDSDATCINWQNFLDEVLPNEEYQNLLQEFLGTVFIDRRKAKLETMLILKGDGANGKSVIFNTVIGLFGPTNVSNFGISALVSGTERKKNIAFINGKRLNYCSEINALNITKENDTLKALISGEPMEARALYGNNFTAYDIPLLMTNCNKLPTFMNWSNGMRRRLMILPFDVTIPIEKQNPLLSTSLASEYSGIFNWIVEGRDRFILNGYRYTECPNVELFYHDEDKTVSNVVQFMHEKTINKAPMFSSPTKTSTKKYHWESAKFLQMMYGKWCKSKGIDPFKRHAFKVLMLEAGYEYKRCSNGYCYKVYEEK